MPGVAQIVVVEVNAMELLASMGLLLLAPGARLSAAAVAPSASGRLVHFQVHMPPFAPGGFVWMLDATVQDWVLQHGHSKLPGLYAPHQCGLVVLGCWD
jgi:hypothetical protein